jgi:hypothetical protein
MNWLQEQLDYAQRCLNRDKADAMEYHPCFCVGKQNGEPYCPCVMRQKNVRKEGDEWVIPERRIKA